MFCCYLPFASFAWGVEGHRIVGHIAESYLTENARKEIRKILGTESIAMASNWADFIKSDTSFNYISSWHYINLKGGLSSTELKAYLSQDTAVDVYTRINFLVKELKSKKLSKENKIFYSNAQIHFYQ